MNMNTERAIREAVEEHYASLYDPNYVLREEVRFCLDQAFHREYLEPEEQPPLDNWPCFRRRALIVNSHR